MAAEISMAAIFRFSQHIYEGNQRRRGLYWEHLGWKMSFISLAFILLVLLLMFGRYRYLKSTGQYDPNKVDTTQIEIID